MLETADLNITLSKEEYKQRMPILQRQLRYLQRMTGESKRPVIIVFEGWDGAGKGSNIKKLTEYLDPRHFEVHSTVAPSTEEKMRPFLWRFWVRLPAYGDFAVLTEAGMVGCLLKE